MKLNPRLMALAACAFALGMPFALAHQHAFLDHSVPAVGATVDAAPRELDMFFTEGVAPPFCTVTVSREGKPVAIGTLHGGKDDKELIVPLPKLALGTYTVVWRATSVDSHKTEGTFHFAVGH